MSQTTISRIGMIVFLIPLTIFLLWIRACSVANGYPANVELYSSYFPEFQQGQYTLTLLSLMFIAVSILLSSSAKKSVNKVERIIAYVVVIGGYILGIMNIFSLM